MFVKNMARNVFGEIWSWLSSVDWFVRKWEVIEGSKTEELCDGRWNGFKWDFCTLPVV